RAVDGRLIGVVVKVDLLVRVSTVHIGRYVARDGDQRNGVQRRGGDTGDPVHHPGTDVHQQDTWLAGCPGVAVRRVGGGLLVPRDDEADRAASNRVQQRDVRVPA